MFNLAVLACVLKTTTKKGRKKFSLTFSGKKFTLRETPGYAYVNTRHGNRGPTLQHETEQRIKTVNLTTTVITRALCKNVSIHVV